MQGIQALSSASDNQARERVQSGFPKGKRHVRHHKLVALSPVLSSSPSQLLFLPCALIRLELGVHKVFPVQKLSRAGAEGGNHTEHPPVLAAPTGRASPRISDRRGMQDNANLRDFIIKQETK